MPQVTLNNQTIHKGQVHKQLDGEDQCEWVATFDVSNGGTMAVKWIGEAGTFPPSKMVDKAHDAALVIAEICADLGVPVQIGYDSLNTFKVAGAKVEGRQAHIEKPKKS